MFVAALATLVLTATIPPTMRLWNGPAPGSQGTGPADVPMLTSFIPDHPSGAAFVVCPGGGYGMLADHEGAPVAKWLNTLGVTAFVLRYRLGPKYHYPYITGDVLRALQVVRSHAEEWSIDPHRIGILGFSAGGHLAASAATLFSSTGSPDASDPVDRVSSRPDAAVLIYPVITMKDPFTHRGSRENLLGKNPSPELIEKLSIEDQVSATTPPTFIASAADDDTVPIENSIGYILACRKFKVPIEAHFYKHGPHGFGLGGNDPELSQWPASCAIWLRGLGFTN